MIQRDGERCLAIGGRLPLDRNHRCERGLIDCPGVSVEGEHDRRGENRFRLRSRAIDIRQLRRGRAKGERNVAAVAAENARAQLIEHRRAVQHAPVLRRRRDDVQSIDAERRIARRLIDLRREPAEIRQRGRLVKLRDRAQVAAEPQAARLVDKHRRDRTLMPQLDRGLRDRTEIGAESKLPGIGAPSLRAVTQRDRLAAKAREDSVRLAELFLQKLVGIRACKPLKRLPKNGDAQNHAVAIDDFVSGEEDGEEEAEGDNRVEREKFARQSTTTATSAGARCPGSVGSDWRFTHPRYCTDFWRKVKGLGVVIGLAQSPHRVSGLAHYEKFDRLFRLC